MDTSSIIGLAILAIVVHIVILLCVSHDLKTRHKAFWWMFFFSIPVGVLITILLDIKENTDKN